MKNVLKIVFLGVIGIFALTYLTVQKPEVTANDNLTTSSYATLPAQYELVGVANSVKKEDLFKPNTKTLVVVGNHDSLAIVKELPSLFDVKVPYVMVANISSAPWFVKKMFIPGKLEELNEGTKIPMVFDMDGAMIQSLKVTDNSKTKFMAYMLNENGSISQLYTGEVKEGALDGSMNKEEKIAALKPLFELL